MEVTNRTFGKRKTQAWLLAVVGGAGGSAPRFRTVGREQLGGKLVSSVWDTWVRGAPG